VKIPCAHVSKIRTGYRRERQEEGKESREGEEGRKVTQDEAVQENRNLRGVTNAFFTRRSACALDFPFFFKQKQGENAWNPPRERGAFARIS